MRCEVNCFAGSFLEAEVPDTTTLPAIERSRSIQVAQIPPPLERAAVDQLQACPALRTSFHSLGLDAHLCETSLLSSGHRLDDEPRRIRVAPGDPR